MKQQICKFILHIAGWKLGSFEGSGLDKCPAHQQLGFCLRQIVLHVNRLDCQFPDQKSMVLLSDEPAIQKYGWDTH